MNNSKGAFTPEEYIDLLDNIFLNLLESNYVNSEK